MDRLPARSRSKLVAGAAGGSYGVRRLAVSSPVVVCRQRTPDEPGLADRRRSVAGKRLSKPLIPGNCGRLRRRHRVQTWVARNALDPLQLRGAPGLADRL